MEVKEKNGELLPPAEDDVLLEISNKKRIFINCVDLYPGRNFAKYLSQCIVGATAEKEEEEEDSEQDLISEGENVTKSGTYEIIGTLHNKDAKKPDFVNEILLFENKEDLYKQLSVSDVIVYDITTDSAQIEEAIWAATELHNNIDKIEKTKPKTFILVSTVLTWARSKVNEEEPELPFMEEDYRKRRPHPDFKDHIEAEREITKLGKTDKSKLSTYVVAAGLTYGAEEDIFHYLFKAGWHNNEELLCYGKGKNIIPMIHIKDLAAVIQNIADNRPKVRYMIAVDESSTIDQANTLYDIVKAVSQALTTGKVKKISIPDALLIRDLKQRDLSYLTVDLRMSSAYIKENMSISWTSEEGLVENIDKIVEEYKVSRNLLPVRLMVLGPPSCGKSTVVQQLCEQFKLHHINVKDVIEEAVGKRTRYLQSLKDKEAELEAKLSHLDMGEEDEEEEEEEEEEQADEGRAAEYEKLLQIVNESKEQNHGRIDDSLIITFYREKLLSRPCQNQGFVIDGFPRALELTTTELARDIFENEEEDDDNGARLEYDQRMMPELIVSLEATDAFIRHRIINLPEDAIVGTHNTEQGLTRRLAAYRHANTDDETLLNYFDELEIHPQKIDISSDESLRMKNTVERIARMVKGGPRNYGPTEDELKEAARIEMEKKIKKEEEEQKELRARESEEKLIREKQQQEWTKKFERVVSEEQELLTAQSQPLRNYLMKFVMPTLTQGLVECCKVRPEDPVDYLAEYLFRNNPQVD